MDQHEHLSKAREKARCNAANRRANTLFTLDYRGGGTTQIVGYKALAAALNIKQSSIPVLLSNGGGASFQLMRCNPLTGEQDVLQVTRTLPVKLKHLRKTRGRPPSRLKLAVQAEHDLQARQQAEERAKLQSRKTGTLIAESARTVPKETNRRRATKP